MRIAMVASEAAPFVKTGGLGDVMQALPNALSKLKGNEICLFLPYYKRIKEDPAIETEQVGSFSMELAWRESYVGILRLKSRRKKLQVYFIDNDYYFGARSTVYGDSLRFVIARALCARGNLGKALSIYTDCRANARAL